MGRFKIVRPLRLLDVAALESLMVDGSIFDPGHARRLERARFLKRLSARLTMPVMPENEAVHHLVTQATADYLVGRTQLNLDRILYPSVQSDAAGHNIVLFHRSARCEAIDLPSGTKIKGKLYDNTEDGVEADYWVWEEVPSAEQEKENKADDFPDFELFLGPIAAKSDDTRPTTLRMEIASLKVHHVNAVTFKTDVYKVARHRVNQRSKADF